MAHSEDYTAGGCGSQNGGTSIDEFSQLEKQLAENQDAEGREQEISVPKQKAQQTGRSGRGNQKPIKVQTIGHCEKCGYISSQKICKACTLLDGLNKNRPKTTIELVGVEEEESSSTLMRQMEGIQLSNG
jgi:cytoplasmic tRNA 2-thiolation protein 1